MSFLVKVVNYFLQTVLFLIVNRQPELALLRPQHHALALHASHHIKRETGFTTERHLKKVLLDALLHRLAKLGLYLEVSVRRTKTADPLVRTLVVVILHPLPYPFLGILEALELRTGKELQKNRLPEPFDFPQRHGMVRLRFDMMHPVLLQLVDCQAIGIWI